MNRLFAIAGLVVAFALGCVSAPEPSAGSASHLEGVEGATSMRDVFRTMPKELAVDRERMTIQGVDACAFVRPLASLEHAYFFGGYMLSGVEAGVRSFGVEVVVDVYGQRAGVYWYPDGGLAAIADVRGGSYTGVAIDTRAPAPNDPLAEAFAGAALSAGVEALVATDLRGFASKDGLVFGGVALVPGGRFAGLIHPLTSGTKRYLLDRETRRELGGTGEVPVALPDAAAVTNAILQVGPGLPAGAFGDSRLSTLAFVAIVLGAKSTGNTLADLCP